MNNFKGKPNSGIIKVFNTIVKNDGTSHKSTKPLEYYGMFQAFEDEERVQQGITYGKSLYLYTDFEANISESSKIEDWQDRTWTVRAVERWDAKIKRNKHTRLEVVIEGKRG